MTGQSHWLGKKLNLCQLKLNCGYQKQAEILFENGAPKAMREKGL